MRHYVSSYNPLCAADSTHVVIALSPDRTLFHAFYANDPDAKSAAASQSLQLGALGFGGNRAPVASHTPGKFIPAHYNVPHFCLPK